MYILLMRSRTILSRIVHLITGAEYTHVAIGVEPNRLYTMTRYDLRFMLPAGLTLEHEYKQYPHQLLYLETPEEIRYRLADILREYYVHSYRYRYSVLGLLPAWFGIPWYRERKMLCSEFAARVMRESGVYIFPKSDNLVRPMDFLKIPGIKGVDDNVST